MALDARRQAWLALSLAEGVGPRTAHSLLRAFDSPESVLGASRAAIAAVAGKAVADALSVAPDPELIARTVEWLDTPGHELLTWEDSAYPQALLATVDPPPVLYATGRIELLNRPAIAVVGSRNATAGGSENAEAFGRALADGGLTIVSGLALGIDAAAHRGGLEGTGGSVAVIGTGIDRVYPAKNRSLAHRLAVEGAIVSEYPLGTPALAGNFPRRNRLIAGLALGVLVVEAALGSGSLVTARLALEAGRDVFAIPGSIHSPLAKGCHRLIKDGAKLVESADDVLSELGMSAAGPGATGGGRSRQSSVRGASGPAGIGAPGHPSPTQPGGPAGPAGAAVYGGVPESPSFARAGGSDPTDTAVLDALGHDPATADDLVRRTGLPAATVQARLATLEIHGLVVALAGARFVRR